jgi:Tfp pilus assembly protein PilX
MKRLAPYNAMDVYAIKLAVVELRLARDHLRRSKANRAADYVACALKSAEGALRHAKSKEFRT